LGNEQPALAGFFICPLWDWPASLSRFYAGRLEL
jgi:hypothetical protein